MILAGVYDRPPSFFPLEPPSPRLTGGSAAGIPGFTPVGTFETKVPLPLFQRDEAPPPFLSDFMALFSVRVYETPQFFPTYEKTPKARLWKFGPPCAATKILTPLLPRWEHASPF